MQKNCIKEVGESQNLINEVYRKEEQLKLLVEYISIKYEFSFSIIVSALLMEKCEEKIQLQNDRVEKLEGEIDQLKEENLSLNNELQMNQVSFL